MYSPLKSIFKSLSEISLKNFTRISFVVINIIYGFISTAILFTVHHIKKYFSVMGYIFPKDYELYLHVLVILAVLAVGVAIYGCYCVDEKSSKATSIYLVLVSVSFIGFLTYIAYFMLFAEEFTRKVTKIFIDAEAYKKTDVENWLKCHGIECNDALYDTVRKNLHQIVVNCSVVIILQVFCKFIGSKFLIDLFQEEKAILLRYFKDDIETPKQLIVPNQKN